MTFKKLTEASKTKYTEADFAWDEKAMVAEYKAVVLDYMNGASMDDALKAIKAMLKDVGGTIIKGKGPVRESKTTKITKSELKDMIRGVLREELAYKNELEEARAKKQIVYVLSTFSGKEYIYNDFYLAVEDAENKYCTEANSVYPYYLNADGTYTDMVPDGKPGCLCWTDEEGIIE